MRNLHRRYLCQTKIIMIEWELHYRRLGLHKNGKLILKSAFKILNNTISSNAQVKNWKEFNCHNPANLIDLLYVSPSQLKIVNVFHGDSLMCTLYYWINVLHVYSFLRLWSTYTLLLGTYTFINFEKIFYLHKIC